MANSKISQLNSLTNSTVDVTDVLPIVDTSGSETKKITYQNAMRPKDNVFGIVGSSDTTKIAQFEVDGLTTATTRTITIPNANTTMVGTDATQTLTNKTLTSPQINFGSDARGDIPVRNSSGVTSRLPIGTSGQILSSNASGDPEWIANPAATDASTTVKGVIEIATTAEITAGTSTGGTGAILVIPASAVGSAGASKLVQYDSSGKYPAADGSAITNITIPVGSYVSTVTTESQITTTNRDTTFTPGFQAKNITIYYWMNGKHSGTQQYTVGIGTWNGTSYVAGFKFQNNTATATTAFNYNNTVVDTTAPTAGGASGSHMKVDLSVTSVTSTQFTVRVAFDTADSSGGGCTYYVVATQ